VTHPEFEIVRAGAERLDEVRSLYRALDDQHGSLLPTVGVATKRPPDEAWTSRRANYEAWLAEGAFLLLAIPATDAGAAPVGYAMVTLEDTGSDGWDTGSAGTVESLSVDGAWRGQGVGGALLDAAERELAARGVRSMVISVIEPNDRARALYERRGMVGFSRTLIGPVRADA
jgi:ribosomal protein S18 acetylase RimI-like enzyme